MKRIKFVALIIAMILPAGCTSSGSGTTAPSTNPSKPSAARKLVVKAPAEKSIKQNGTVEADFSVTRDNFAGPIDLEFRDLPSGVSVVTKDLTIPAGKDSLKVTLRATADAKVANEQVAHVAAKARDERDMKEDVAEFKLDIKPKD